MPSSVKELGFTQIMSKLEWLKVRKVTEHALGKAARKVRRQT